MRAGLELWARDSGESSSRSGRRERRAARGQGPRGSSSSRAVTRFSARTGATPPGRSRAPAEAECVWNHGAAADDVQQLPGVVSVGDVRRAATSWRSRGRPPGSERRASPSSPPRAPSQPSPRKGLERKAPSLGVELVGDPTGADCVLLCGPVEWEADALSRAGPPWASPRRRLARAPERPARLAGRDARARPVAPRPRRAVRARGLRRGAGVRRGADRRALPRARPCRSALGRPHRSRPTPSSAASSWTKPGLQQRPPALRRPLAARPPDARSGGLAGEAVEPPEVVLDREHLEPGEAGLLGVLPHRALAHHRARSRRVLADHADRQAVEDAEAVVAGARPDRRRARSARPSARRRRSRDPPSASSPRSVRSTSTGYDMSWSASKIVTRSYRLGEARVGRVRVVERHPVLDAAPRQELACPPIDASSRSIPSTSHLRVARVRSRCDDRPSPQATSATRAGGSPWSRSWTSGDRGQPLGREQVLEQRPGEARLALVEVCAVVGVGDAVARPEGVEQRVDRPDAGDDRLRHAARCSSGSSRRGEAPRAPREARTAARRDRRPGRRPRGSRSSPAAPATRGHTARRSPAARCELARRARAPLGQCPRTGRAGRRRRRSAGRTPRASPRRAAPRAASRRSSAVATDAMPASFDRDFALAQPMTVPCLTARAV